MSEAPIDLNFLARQVQRVIDEQQTTREDIRVLTAVVMRMDATQAALLNEVRAVHGQISRFDARLRQMEAGE